MGTNELNSAINELMQLFPGSFINSGNELILEPKTNLYFCLDDIESLLDLHCKVISWCSRAACKTAPYHTNWQNEKYQAKVRERINEFLGTDFAVDEWYFIYTYLGNDVNRTLCKKFVLSNYDLDVIKLEKSQ